MEIKSKEDVLQELYPTRKFSFTPSEVLKVAEVYASQFKSLPSDDGGMRWVKVSERLPDKRHNYFVKMKTPDEGRVYPSYIYNTTCLFDGKTFVDDINVAKINYGEEVVEWLDESPSPEPKVIDGGMKEWENWFFEYCGKVIMENNNPNAVLLISAAVHVQLLRMQEQTDKQLSGMRKDTEMWIEREKSLEQRIVELEKQNTSIHEKLQAALNSEAKTFELLRNTQSARNDWHDMADKLAEEMRKADWDSPLY